ncbi:MAG: pirin family protein [Deltaproteobacteria bacterium]|jgi:redox-sensitive bicupin YhaK (pirin superfamily)|nr:pirin family protein [Deltaproteobacteria bacterium]
MGLRQVIDSVKGHPTVDGAGVHLVRVLGTRTVELFDPFLMLDSFDSHDPNDYLKGFPFHPHRGIETITYLLEGSMEHQDSLGNKGYVNSGESQWMTAGSGIMHQEMPVAGDWMLGVQIWLNLPKVKKMTQPAYFDIKKDMIPLVKTSFGEVRVLSGEYDGQLGVKPPYIQATLLDLLIKVGQTAQIPCKSAETAFIFQILGDSEIGGVIYKEKTAVLFGPGESVEVKAVGPKEARFLFFQAPPLKEPVSWGGPIVMNTDAELKVAYKELESGLFIKSNPTGA